MYALSAVKTALETNAPSLAQVILPDVVDSQQVDSAALITTLVGAQVSNLVYPLVNKNSPGYPCVVYQQVSMERVDVDGYQILRDDGFVLQVQAQTYGTMVTAAQNIRDALLDYNPSNAAGSVLISDQADRYTEDLELFETGLAVTVTHLARTSQALPAAFVYPLEQSVDTEAGFSSVSSSVTERFAVLWAAKIPANGVSALGSLQDEILGAVNGLASDVNCANRVRWGGGELLSVYNSIALWRDLYSVDWEAVYS